MKMQKYQENTITVAPMMEWTDRAEKQSVIST
jgi:tRNA-dihydrouridine synthase